jgi:hypothetical protein
MERMMNSHTELTRIQQQLENAKSDPAKLIRYLEQAEEATDAELALGAMRLRKQLQASGGVDTTRAYRFLFRNAANYFAEHGGFVE